MNNKIGLLWMGWFIKWLIYICHQCCCYLKIYIIYGYILSMVLNLVSHGKTVRSRFVFRLCLCQDKPYGTIILTTISFCAYNNNYKLWNSLPFNIWIATNLLYKHQSMFWIFCCFYIVTITSFCAFCMLYNVWLGSCHPFYRTLLFFSSLLTILL